MKIRWTQAGMRLRITPTELRAIVGGEPVGEALPLAGWSVRVVLTDGATCLTADVSALTLALSRADAARLAEPDREGVYFQQDGPVPLRYLIEKDFPCVHPHAMEAMEVPTETFPEPTGFRERKGEC